MKGFLGKRSFLKVCGLVAGIILLFSCSNEKDMSEETIAALGEPDVTLTGGSGSYEYKIFVYSNRNVNRAYYFNKSASCGGKGGKWYVSYVYTAENYGYTLYEPPTIVHTAVKTAKPGKSILITATVTDDGQVANVILFYRVPGETDYQPITMGPENDIFTADIPAEAVTAAGIQYYIEATDNDEHKSRLPVSKYYSITVSADTTSKTIGRPDTTGSSSGTQPSGVSGFQTSPLGL